VMEALLRDRTQPPPAERGEYDTSLATPVCSAQRAILSELHVIDYHRSRKLIAQLIENESRKIFAAWNELAVSKLGDVDVDVPVIEPVLHFVRENPVQMSEVDDESSQRIDLSTDRDLAHIGMAVKTLARTKPEHFLILFFAPLGPAIAMGGSERNCPRKGGSRHRRVIYYFETR
jgi:hypothetical protein